MLKKSKNFQDDFLDSSEALRLYEIGCAEEKRDKALELTYEIGTQMKYAEDAFW